jgi:hypothetical protein
MQVARKVSTELPLPPRSAAEWRGGGGGGGVVGEGVGGCITTQQTTVSTILFRLSSTP